MCTSHRLRIILIFSIHFTCVIPDFQVWRWSGCCRPQGCQARDPAFQNLKVWKDLPFFQMTVGQFPAMLVATKKMIIRPSACLVSGDKTGFFLTRLWDISSQKMYVSTTLLFCRKILSKQLFWGLGQVVFNNKKQRIQYRLFTGRFTYFT